MAQRPGELVRRLQCHVDVLRHLVGLQLPLGPLRHRRACRPPAPCHLVPRLPRAPRRALGWLFRLGLLAQQLLCHDIGVGRRLCRRGLGLGDARSDHRRQEHGHTELARPDEHAAAQVRDQEVRAEMRAGRGGGDVAEGWDRDDGGGRADRAPGGNQGGGARHDGERAEAKAPRGQGQDPRQRPAGLREADREGPGAVAGR
mmetsp:Transcript_23265/g.72457  ORF Transcript_23265/g.72457 Transcript_23265/m.72457 type:complete len:201 (-) Transcript_23265:262-864(-)